jgi:catechol-2,3-dioxygenase
MKIEINFSTLIIFVQDVTKLKGFYAEILQLEIIEEMQDEWVVLKAGNCQIALHKIGMQYLTPSNEFKVDNKTKMVFETDEDIFKLREHLLKKKVKLRDVKTFENYNYWLCDGEDPEGNVFQFKQAKS